MSSSRRTLPVSAPVAAAVLAAAGVGHGPGGKCPVTSSRRTAALLLHPEPEAFCARLEPSNCMCHWILAACCCYC